MRRALRVLIALAIVGAPAAAAMRGPTGFQPAVLEVTWTFTHGGAPASCAAVGAQTVEVESRGPRGLGRRTLVVPCIDGRVRLTMLPGAFEVRLSVRGATSFARATMSGTSLQDVAPRRQPRSRRPQKFA